MLPPIGGDDAPGMLLKSAWTLIGAKSDISETLLRR
jgi:hypothetical protein